MVVAILVLSALGGACSDEPDDEAAAPTTASTTTTARSDVPMSVDWTKRVPPTSLGDWTVQSCEGDAPLLCISGPDGDAGIIERSAFPLSSLAYATDDEMATLRAHARDFYTSFVEDRAEGCGREYELRAIEPTEVEVAGERGLRYGFAGNRPGEKASERHVNHALIRGSDLVIIGLPAYDDNACVAKEQEMTTAAQAAFEPQLPALIAGMRLP